MFKKLMFAAAMMVSTPALGHTPLLAIIDTGVKEAPSIKGKVIGNMTFSDKQAPEIASEHGTWVATAVNYAARGSKFEILGLRIDETNTCVKSTQLCYINPNDRVAAVYQALRSGADVILITSAGKFSDELVKAINYALDADVEVIVSAGNDNGAFADVDRIEDAPNFHVVVSTEDRSRAKFSSRSDSKAVVTANGVDVRCQSSNGMVESMSGTSFSAATYAGNIIAKMALTRR